MVNIPVEDWYEWTTFWYRSRVCKLRYCIICQQYYALFLFFCWHCGELRFIRFTVVVLRAMVVFREHLIEKQLFALVCICTENAKSFSPPSISL